MFDLERMEEALQGESFRVPKGLTRGQLSFLIKFSTTDKKTYRDIESLTDENMKGSIVELMYSKKLWDEEILQVGGISYYPLPNPEKRTTSDGKLFKTKYRVSMTSKTNSTKLKFKVKTASGAIFSVASKTCGEAQMVVDSIFGKGMYRVSQMLV